MAASRSRAPEFPAGLEWFNVTHPVRLAEQAGQLVLLSFSTFCSVYCQHVLKDIHYLGRKYKDDLVIISVHSPKFPGERRRSHVHKAINRHHINCPLVHDPELKLWNAYGIKAWPTQVLIDRDGIILGAISGEGKLDRLEQVIRHQAGKRTVRPPGTRTAVSCTRSPEPSAALSFPGRIIASADRVYIADSGQNRILVTSGSGHVLRQYGSESPGFIDGNGSAAAFNNPQGMVLADEFLYVADEGNHAIRRIHIHTDDVVTIAGTGKAGGELGSPAAMPTAVSLNSPNDLAIKEGDLYIAMTGLHQIWRLSLITNTIEVFSGSGREGLVDGAPNAAAFAQPTGVTILGNRLYTADASASAVRCVNLVTGGVTTLVGEGLFSYGGNDGTGTAARLQSPLDIKADLAHKMLWVADTYNNKIRRIGVESQFVSSLVLDRSLDEPGGLAFHDNTLYIANTTAHEILRLNPDDGHAEALNVTEELAEI
jgi:peroxiredoxin